MKSFVLPLRGSLANLVLGCTRQHLHLQAGWQVKFLPDGDVAVTTPDSRVLTSRPPLRGLPAPLALE